jgi:hypothetical protein
MAILLRQARDKGTVVGKTHQKETVFLQYSDHDVETPHGIMLMGDTIKQFIVQHNHFDNAARVYHVGSNATARPTVKDTLIVVRLLAVS